MMHLPWPPQVPFALAAAGAAVCALACAVFFLWSRLLRHQVALRTQELEKAKLKAESCDRAKSLFLANMCHELQTRLTAVSDIHNSGENLLGLVNEILDLSKLDAGKCELEERDVDVARVVREAVHLLQGQAEKAGIKLITQVDPQTPLLRADEQRLRQILVNLMSNAAKFTAQGGSVTLSARATGLGMVIEVRDTGTGMPEADIAKAMEGFVQIDGTNSTGLGLPISKRLVELHGGTLTIRSKADAGTTATVILPKARLVRRSAQSVRAKNYAEPERCAS